MGRIAPQVRRVKMTSESPSSVAPEQLAQRACVELDRRMRAGEPARAEEYLSSVPGLSTHISFALDLVYAEFVAREELGQRPNPEEWFSRFPQLRQDLQQLL